MRGWLISLLTLMLPGVAAAADLVVSVRTAAGAPVSDAVVSLPEIRGPLHAAGPYRMAQHDLQFDPFVLVAPVGAEVAFPNLDRVRHHVYSFSPAHPFELKLYGRDESRSVRFDKPGVVALGCNIHDTMVGTITLAALSWHGFERLWMQPGPRARPSRRKDDERLPVGLGFVERPRPCGTRTRAPSCNSQRAGASQRSGYPPRRVVARARRDPGGFRASRARSAVARQKRYPTNFGFPKLRCLPRATAIGRLA